MLRSKSKENAPGVINSRSSRRPVRSHMCSGQARPRLPGHGPASSRPRLPPEAPPPRLRPRPGARKSLFPRPTPHSLANLPFHLS